MALGRYPRLAIPVTAASAIGFGLLSTGLLFNNQAAGLLDRPDWLGIVFQQSPSVSSWAKFSLYDVFFNYDLGRSYDPFLWTMPIEMAGSFILFSILLLAGPSLRVRVAYYAVAFILTWQLQPLLTPFVYGVACAEFMASGWFARLSTGWSGNLIGCTIFAIGALGSALHRSHAMHSCGLLALAIVSGAAMSPALRCALQWPISRILGRLSFPLYLVHGFVVYGFSCWAALHLSAAGYPLQEMAALIIPASAALSLLAAYAFAPVERFAIWASHRIADAVLSRTSYVDIGKTPAGLTQLSG